ncbi:uncharacterized protein LOC142332969 isoform X7 [Lycorma delicatula]|uniref:uncharacterized protein LOC142332969 isoform X7 n=1 Tax=Lycorma delicatula TaxID=130591 RepID=UPI003F516A50
MRIIIYVMSFFIISAEEANDEKEIFTPETYVHHEKYPKLQARCHAVHWNKGYADYIKGLYHDFNIHWILSIFGETNLDKLKKHKYYENDVIQLKVYEKFSGEKVNTLLPTLVRLLDAIPDKIIIKEGIIYTEADSIISGIDITEIISTNDPNSDDGTVSNDTTNSNNATVSNYTTNSNDAKVSTDTTNSNDATVSNDTTNSNDATVSNDTTNSNDAKVSTDTTNSNDATVTYDTTNSNDATVSTDTTNSNDATVSTDTTNSNDATVSTDTTNSNDTTVSTETTNSNDLTYTDIPTTMLCYSRSVETIKYGDFEYVMPPQPNGYADLQYVIMDGTSLFTSYKCKPWLHDKKNDLSETPPIEATFDLRDEETENNLIKKIDMRCTLRLNTRTVMNNFVEDLTPVLTVIEEKLLENWLTANVPFELRFSYICKFVSPLQTFVNKNILQYKILNFTVSGYQLRKLIFSTQCIGLTYCLQHQHIDNYVSSLEDHFLYKFDKAEITNGGSVENAVGE